ncbi:MAG: RNA polymerase sigma factor [Bacteroidetes bacterium]|nr:RNA polymerase sigma factor [Bacteroidota bacterium]
MEISRKLIQDCRKSDRKAQFKLYKLCFPVLMSVCSRYKKDENEAAPILNAGFLKILTNLEKHHTDVPFEAWIRRIMINTLIDDFRKNRQVKELIEYRDFTEANHTEDFIDFNEADQQFDAERLENMIKQLPPVSQKVFNLYAIDGYKHREIADLLLMSIGTSKWHLSFARKKLSEMVQKEMNTKSAESRVPS